jgi:hypothetical protein
MNNMIYINKVIYSGEDEYNILDDKIDKAHTSRYILENYTPIEPFLNKQSQIAPLQKWYLYVIDLDAIKSIKDLEVSVFYHKLFRYPLSVAKLGINMDSQNSNLDVLINIDITDNFTYAENEILTNRYGAQGKHKVLAPHIEATADKLQKTIVEDLISVWKKFRGAI